MGFLKFFLIRNHVRGSWGATGDKRGHYEKSQWTKCKDLAAAAPLSWPLSHYCCANCCLLLMVHTAQPALSVPLTAKSTACAELAPSGTVPVPALAVQSPATKGYTTGCFKVSGLIRQTDLANKTSVTAFYFRCRRHS